MQKMNSMAVKLALGVALALLIGQFFFRPLWRDEFWALYFAAPDDSLLETIRFKISNDVHPPLYFSLLHGWLQIFQNEIFARFLNLVFIVLAGFSAWIMRGKRVEETKLYLFLCATSFWLIFYSAEVRMMGGLFLISGLLVLAARNSLDAPDRLWRWPILYALIGAIAASSHFYGSLWVACLGAAVGLAHLLAGRVKLFFAFAIASLIAIVPIIAWILFARPDQNPGASEPLASFLEGFEFAANQFLRGIIVKTIFANLIAFIVGCLGLRALLQRGTEDRLPHVLLFAIGLLVVIVFTVHLSILPFIKERAFIVIIPALFYLLAIGILSLHASQSRAIKLVKWIPIAAIISLPLFSSEFFKDRERVGALQNLMAAAPECSGDKIAAYMRPSDQAADFSNFMTEYLLSDAVPGGYDLRPLDEVDTEESADIFRSDCPIKVIGINLPRGERPDHQLIRDEMTNAGFDVEALEEVRMGGGRARAWVLSGE